MSATYTVNFILDYKDDFVYLAFFDNTQGNDIVLKFNEKQELQNIDGSPADINVLLNHIKKVHLNNKTQLDDC